MYLLKKFYVSLAIVDTAPELCQKCDFSPENRIKSIFGCSGSEIENLNKNNMLQSTTWARNNNVFLRVLKKIYVSLAIVDTAPELCQKCDFSPENRIKGIFGCSGSEIENLNKNNMLQSTTWARNNNVLELRKT